MEIASSIFFVGLMIFLAHLFADLFSRTKIPDVLWLMLIGLGIGPLLGFVTVGEFGELGTVFAMITLVVILFQGGLDLKLDTLRRSIGGSVSLTVMSFVVTTAAVGLLMILIAGWEPIMAFMLGAILGGTSSAVVIPMVRQLEMRPESKTMLLLESALSDVLCIVVAIAFIEAWKLGDINVGGIAGKIAASFLISSIVGIAAAIVWSLLLEKVRREENSIFLTPALAFVIFGVAEMLGYSGAITALAFGVALGNADLVNSFLSRTLLKRIRPLSLNAIEKAFFSEAGFLLKTFFFVYIGVSIVLASQALMAAGLVVALAVFYVRVPIVWASVPRSVPVRDASLMAVMVPKGLAAAVLAAMPARVGVPLGNEIQSVTYAVVLFSIVLCSGLVFGMEKLRLHYFYAWIYRSFGKSRVSAPAEEKPPEIEAPAKV